jgi:hypothetical protein
VGAERQLTAPVPTPAINGWAETATAMVEIVLLIGTPTTHGLRLKPSG